MCHSTRRRGRHVTGDDALAGGWQLTALRARGPPLALPTNSARSARGTLRRTGRGGRKRRGDEQRSAPRPFRLLPPGEHRRCRRLPGGGTSPCPRRAADAAPPAPGLACVGGRCAPCFWRAPPPPMFLFDGGRRRAARYKTGRATVPLPRRRGRQRPSLFARRPSTHLDATAVRLGHREASGHTPSSCGTARADLYRCGRPPLYASPCTLSKTRLGNEAGNRGTTSGNRYNHVHGDKITSLAHPPPCRWYIIPDRQCQEISLYSTMRRGATL